jgi:hypothetical protein
MYLYSLQIKGDSKKSFSVVRRVCDRPFTSVNINSNDCYFWALHPVKHLKKLLRGTALLITLISSNICQTCFYHLKYKLLRSKARLVERAVSSGM